MFHVIPVEIVQENRKKNTYNLGSIRFQKGAKHLARRGLFTHTLKITYNVPVNHVLGSGSKNILRK